MEKCSHSKGFTNAEKEIDVKEKPEKLSLLHTRILVAKLCKRTRMCTLTQAHKVSTEHLFEVGVFVQNEATKQKFHA